MAQDDGNDAQMMLCSATTQDVQKLHDPAMFYMTQAKD